MSRPFYETIYHVEGWTLADAFRPQPGWGVRRFTVKVADLGEHTEQELIDAARAHAPQRHRLTSVTLYPADGPERVIWSTPPDQRFKTAPAGVSLADGQTKSLSDADDPPKMVKCPSCRGSCVEGIEQDVCPVCDGQGLVPESDACLKFLHVAR